MSIIEAAAILNFYDSNIILKAHDTYFYVHQGVLMRHSVVLTEMINALKLGDQISQSKAIIELDEEPIHVQSFLVSLYDGS